MCIYSKKLQFAAYGQFVLVFVLSVCLMSLSMFFFLQFSPLFLSPFIYFPLNKFPPPHHNSILRNIYLWNKEKLKSRI